MSIGLAMIVKDGADTMEAAIAPFVGKVDEISIVLGGQSSDDTPGIAARFADVVSDFEGEPGAPFNFGAARQQAFDQLATDWIVTVDADDVWTGVDLLAGFVEEAAQLEAVAISVRYVLGGSNGHQPRIFCKDSGQWVGAVHELYKLPPGSKVLKTSDLVVTQTKDKHRDRRAIQNVAIGEWAIAQDATSTRAMAHLIKDYIAIGQKEKAAALCDVYLEAHGDHNSEYLSVLTAKAEIALDLDDYDTAAYTALKMLKVKPFATAWTVLAEALNQMAEGSQGLLDLAVFAADQAIFSGKTRDVQFHRLELSGSIPCLIKAQALHRMGDDRRALQMADLGRMIDPNNEQLAVVQKELAYRLNEAI